jgi:hypothetical protein
MSAQQEIMKQVKKTLAPINEALTELDEAADIAHGEKDLLLARSSALCTVLGPRHVSLHRDGDLYHKVQTREQLANEQIYIYDSLAILEAGASTREAAARHVLGNVELINQLIKPIDAEDPHCISDMVARGQDEEAEVMIAAALKAAAEQGDDIYTILAKKMVNTVKLYQENITVSSRMSDMATMLSKNKALLEAQKAHDAPVRTVCMGDKVVHLLFPARPMPHDQLLPGMVSGE